MKTLINAVSALLVLTALVLLLGSDLYLEVVPMILALAISLVLIRLSIKPEQSADLMEGPTSVEFMAQADAIGFELFLEYVEEEDFDISGDFEDVVIICWISNPEGTPLTTMQLEGLLEMQKFLCQWA